MKYVVYVIAGITLIVVGLFFADWLNLAIGERRIQQARFYLEGPNPDEASKRATQAIKGIKQFPTVRKARKERALDEGVEVLFTGLRGMFAEQYLRDERFHPGPQWEICEARARVHDKALCIDAAAMAVSDVAHNSFASGLGDDGTGLMKACIDYETRPEIAMVCREHAGEWLGVEAAKLLEKGNAPAAAAAMQSCVTNGDYWAPSEQCLADWHVTVRRARNSLVPEFKSCEAILYYADMPEGIPAGDRTEAEAELAELRSTTALIETIYHYDTIEFRPATGYFGRGEESTKYHLAKALTPLGYTIQWSEEEHAKGAWDNCQPRYKGKIETHEARGRMVQAFKKECLTVRIQPELTLVDTTTGRVWLHESCEGREPENYFLDEELFLGEAATAREDAWQNAHDQMKDWEFDPPHGKELPEEIRLAREKKKEQR